MIEFPGSEELPRPSARVVAFLPCPVKVPLEHALRQHLGCDDDAAWLQLEGNANKTRADYVSLWRSPPDVFLSPGVNALFLTSSLRARLDSGEFVVPPLPAGARPALADPEGHVLPVATNLTVLVLDLDRLGSRPMPTRWSDLVHPRWAGSVAMRGDRTSYCETTLLTWHRLFGMSGLRALRPAVAWGMHPSQMAKLAGSGRPDSPAVYVMPWMFATTALRKERLRIVWPEEGAIMSPLTLVARRTLDEQARRAVAWLCDRQAGDIMSGAKVPSLLWPAPDEGRPTCFVGWEALRSGALEDTLRAIETFFAPTTA